MPLKLQPAARIEIERLLKLGVIERSTSPFAIPSFFVRKDTDRVRLLSDFRSLNDLSIRKNYTCISPPDQILERFRQFKILTVIDLRDAFYSISLSKSSKIMASFVIPGEGTFTYNRLPLGLCDATATISYVLDTIFPDIRNNFQSYLDDCLMATNSIKKSIEFKFELILKRFAENGIKININKIQLLDC